MTENIDEPEARVAFRVPRHVRNELIALAKERGISLSELLRAYVMHPPKARTPEF